MVKTTMPLPSATSNTRIRVIVADDHVTVREGLSSIIGRQSDMELVGEAANGREAVQLWEALQPHVGLFDLRMPELDGVAAIQEIRQRDPVARIIVLTTFDTDNDIVRAISAGALGYLLKDSAREALLEAIRRVHHGETFIPPALVAKLAAGMSGESLTGRELDVLALMASGKSNKDIGLKLYISDNTVRSHVRAIFSKLNVLSRTAAVAVATRRGLIRS